MAQKICKSLNELRNYIMDKVNEGLDEDVSKVVNDVMFDHIARDVYDVYDPIEYRRRRNYAGLLDYRNIIDTIDGDGNLFVQNATLGNKWYREGKTYRISRNYKKPIAKVIETGIGYDINGWEYDGIGRPFIQNTYDELVYAKWHIKAMKDALIRKGLNVI